MEDSVDVQVFVECKCLHFIVEGRSMRLNEFMEVSFFVFKQWNRGIELFQAAKIQHKDLIVLDNRLESVRNRNHRCLNKKYRLEHTPWIHVCQSRKNEVEQSSYINKFLLDHILNESIRHFIDTRSGLIHQEHSRFFLFCHIIMLSQCAYEFNQWSEILTMIALAMQIS